MRSAKKPLELKTFSKEALKHSLEVDKARPPENYFTEEDNHPWTDAYGADTGLEDINGEPICVGDVVMFHMPGEPVEKCPENGTVGDIFRKKRKYYFRVRRPENGCELYPLFDISAEGESTLEIIGDIYGVYEQEIESIFW